MQKQASVRRINGSKAVALDNRALLAKYRLLQLLALILGAATSFGLHQIFAR